MPEQPTEAKRSLLRFARTAINADSPSVAIVFGAVLLAICLLVQHATGAWDASFTAYPDEPSHFVSSVMIRDYLASGLKSSPLSFARNYYGHYPFFAIGYWPPFYYIATALTFLILGVGRFQALLVSAVAAAGSGTMLYLLLRKRCGFIAACCAGLLFVSLPEVQRWFSAVMTDEMVVFFCLAAAVRLLKYLERPDYRNAILCGICCACATLTKYSGAYICVAPFAACLLLRRFDVIKKPSFLALHATFMILIGPWLLATMKGMAVGLPAVQNDPILSRLNSSIRITMSIFPVPLAIFVVAGLLILIALPMAWREDVATIALLGVGSVALLLLSPVEPESRYFLGAAASLLALSFAGWVAARDRWMPREGGASVALTVSAIVLTLVFMATHLGVYLRAPQEPIRAVVKAITDNPAWTGKRIVVASDLEGPVIAEFAALDRHRPGYVLLRPGKMFADEDWFGKHYNSRYNSAKELEASFSGKNPADLIIWHTRPSARLKPHEKLMDEMIGDGTGSWRKAPAVPAFGGDGSTWSIYEFVPGRQG